MPGGRSKVSEGRGGWHYQSPPPWGCTCLSLGPVFGAKPSSILTMSSVCKPRLCLPPRRCRGGSAARCRYGGRCWHPPRLYGPGPGASAVWDQPGTSLACSRSRSFSTPRFVGGAWRQQWHHPGANPVRAATGADVPGAGCGWPAGLTELISIVSRSPIVIPDHKELGGSWGAEPLPDTRQASLHSPCLS